MAKRMPAPVQPVSVNPNSAPTEREIKLIRLDELVPGSDKSVLEFLGWVNEIEQQKSRVAKSWLSVEDARQCDTPPKHVAPLLLDVSQAAKKLMEVARRNRLGCFGEDVIVRVAKPLAALIVAAEKLVNDATDSTGIDEFAAAAGWLDRELQDAAKLAGLQMRHHNGQRKPVPDPWQYVTLDQMAARVQRGKSTLESWKSKDQQFPQPTIPFGGGRRAHLWLWSDVVPYLRTKAERPDLPDVYPRLK